MYSFKNDYSEFAHPNILKRMLDEENNQYVGYGLDEISENARNKIKSYINKNNEVEKSMETLQKAGKIYEKDTKSKSFIGVWCNRAGIVSRAGIADKITKASIAPAK